MLCTWPRTTIELPRGRSFLASARAVDLPETPPKSRPGRRQRLEHRLNIVMSRDNRHFCTAHVGHVAEQLHRQRLHRPAAIPKDGPGGGADDRRIEQRFDRVDCGVRESEQPRDSSRGCREIDHEFGGDLARRAERNENAARDILLRQPSSEAMTRSTFTCSSGRR